MRLTDFKALTFDCYGTLIDWESGMVAALQPLVAKVGRPLSRNEVLEAHARQESTQQFHTPAKRYSDVLATVYHNLGIDPHGFVQDKSGRPIPILPGTARPIEALV